MHLNINYPLKYEWKTIYDARFNNNQHKFITDQLE